MGGNLPGQSLVLCGQPSQVAAWGSHSAGMRSALIGQKPVLNAAVRIRAPVAQKWPVAAHLFHAREIHVGQDEGLALGGFRYHDTERIAHERVPPELDPLSLAAEPLEPDAVHRGDPAAVGDGVAPLDRLPGVELLLAVLLLLVRMPAD